MTPPRTASGPHSQRWPGRRSSPERPTGCSRFAGGRRPARSEPEGGAAGTSDAPPTSATISAPGVSGAGTGRRPFVPAAGRSGLRASQCLDGPPLGLGRASTAAVVTTLPGSPSDDPPPGRTAAGPPPSEGHPGFDLIGDSPAPVRGGGAGGKVSRVLAAKWRGDARPKLLLISGVPTELRGPERPSRRLGRGAAGPAGHEWLATAGAERGDCRAARRYGTTLDQREASSVRSKPSQKIAMTLAKQ